MMIQELEGVMSQALNAVGVDLPEGFQKSEFVLEHGFLDGIYERKQLKKQINLYIDLIQNLPIRA